MSFRSDLEIYFGAEKAAEVLNITEGNTDPRSYESVDRWYGQCYSPPSISELRLAAINAALGGFGVEAIDIWPLAEYINMGESYEPTVMYQSGEFFVSSWGDFVEELERYEDGSNQP